MKHLPLSKGQMVSAARVKGMMAANTSAIGTAGPLATVLVIARTFGGVALAEGE